MLIAVGALALNGCNTATNSPANSSSNSAMTVNSATGVNSANTGAATPTEALESFIAASKTKDVEARKRVMSKGTLALVEQSAKEQGTTVDEIMKKDDGMPPVENPETRNEIIEGDRASIEVKNSFTGDFDKIPFVKEDGVWKIALDEMIEDIKRQMTEEMNMPAANNSKSVPSTNSNKAAKR